jgi:4-alpha-glucanotransferase
MMEKRLSGILLPVFSLPTRYGIGGFSREAYEFVDRLEEARQSYWQVLPLGPTGYGDSPYQSNSTFAGNPYFVALDQLKEEGFLTQQECDEADCGQNSGYVDYARVYETRFRVLRKAFDRFIQDEENKKKLEAFLEEEKDWLRDYLDFITIKNHLGGIAWMDWPKELRMRKEDALEKIREELKGEIAFQAFIQYEFAVQWKKLKEYANQRGIRIIGDIPIYVSMDGADAWAHPELFQFDEELRPKGVAGVPPDAFCATGQLWGNPLYDWKAHQKDEYSWWVQRIRHSLDWYDVIRIDHFRGFESYYSVPYQELTAERGHWEKGPGLELFNILEKHFPGIDLIAEDLGFLTDEVKEMVKACGFPGMKVLHFAFDSGSGNVYLPHHYPKNCVVYTGTHDNETTKGWYRGIYDGAKWFLHRYMNTSPDWVNGVAAEERIADDLIHLAMRSVSDTCIIPMQDYLNLGNEARINFPSSLGGNNWKWRMLPGQFTQDLAGRIREMAELYSRV